MRKEALMLRIEERLNFGQVDKLGDVIQDRAQHMLGLEVERQQGS